MWSQRRTRQISPGNLCLKVENIFATDYNRYGCVNKLTESIQVPFISEALIERGAGGTQRDIEALFKAEFGDLSGLIVLPDKVTINGTAILDISEPKPSGKKSGNVSPTAQQILDDFDRPAPTPADDDRPTFLLRTIDNGKRLRIAVHGELNQSLRWQLRKLMSDIKTYAVFGYEVDLGQCYGITVTGIGILLLVKENTGADRDAIVLKNCRPAIVERLHWAGMEKYFQILSKQEA